MKATGRIIQTWLGNKGHKSTDCGPFISVHNEKEVLKELLKEIKKQFPDNNCYINDLTENVFISIDK